jgi:hypothetical protein
MERITEHHDARWFAQRMPSPEVLADVLRGDPASRLLGIARDRAIVTTGFDVLPRTGADETAVKSALQLATEAAKRLADQGEQTQLTAEEQAALKLFILLVARPAIFVRDGRVREYPQNWPEVARDEELFPRIIAGVGRIEAADHTKLGTGFLVADRRILTNNHVLCALFGMQPNEWRTQAALFAEKCNQYTELWSKNPAVSPWFELRGELGSNVSSTARLLRVSGHHTEVDMAVVELDANPPDSRRLPLMRAEPETLEGLRVYAVGYPVDDVRDWAGERITPLPVFRRVFGADDESLGTKRFSPGIVRGWRDANNFVHDASTLPGSSGSCIVDFEHRRVVGLHFGGRYEKNNSAVSLWKFQDDPLLKDNGIVFN